MTVGMKRVKSCKRLAIEARLAKRTKGLNSALDVQVPCLDWSGILSQSGVGLAAGKEPGVFHLLPGKELTVLLVEEEAALPRALSRLRESMEDDVIGIDLETTTIVGYSWDSSDEARMQDSFGCGKDLFPSFFDVQRISEELGYHGLGLAALAGRLLGCPFRKARSVTMSNWEARTLAPAQLRYAALDAFVTGQLFRLTIDIQDWRCGNCNRCLGSYQALQSHCHSTGHPPMVSQCFDCGRYRRVTL
ncbi:hypothetical protein QBZ16_005040 [Prototheca wickerhamii]|uniref:C2H2-type domain-containing protein n=1 Tax=Prototheca wickerhamii TaxID=3111 RepID=A0AAD9MGG0_PROWI|nr:hypothetical protein QBZ16_005040 [Prototheca wickerhamii]